jgi:hypothetical protein
MCGKKHTTELSPLIPVGRSIYFTARDFPVLCERIEHIAKELRDARPKSIGDLFETGGIRFSTGHSDWYQFLEDKALF